MFNFLKKCQRVSYSILLVEKNRKLFSTLRPLYFFINYSQFECQSSKFLQSTAQSSVISRYMSKNKKSKRKDYESSDDEDEDSDEEDSDEELGSDIKIAKAISLRLDLVLKQTTRFNRKKIEEHFYDNKIRVNEKVVEKKSRQVVEGDEIDVIKGSVPNSKNLIDVCRVNILKIKFDDEIEKFIIKYTLVKSLKIQNYKGGHFWTEREESQ